MDQKHFSLFDLQSMVRSRLEEAFPFALWVAAEIAELKVNQSGHCYLELVEKGGENAVPRARASAVIWRSTYRMIAPYFAATAAQPLCAGLRVLVKAKVTYHELYGFSLQIVDIDPAYTLGEMELQRQAVIARLREEGVWDMNREAPFPPLVQRIAVLSSRQAAGYRDFCKELERSPYRFEVELFEAFMQGHGAEESIVAALEAVARRCEEFDAVAVIRGGGAQSELGCFNSYRLCSHLAQFPIPVLTGIGHDKDQSVADMVAARMFKTPTAVAAWLAERMAQADRTDAMLEGIAQAAERYLEGERRRLESLAGAVASRSVQLTRQLELQLERLGGGIERAARALGAAERARLEMLGQQLRAGALRGIERERGRLEHARDAVAARHPERILALGFAVVRRRGRAVRDAAELEAGERVRITFAKGEADAKIMEYGDEQ